VEFSLENTKALQAKEKRLQTLKNSPKKASKVVTSGSQAKVERPEGVKPGLPSHHGPKVLKLWSQGAKSKSIRFNFT